jgi:hypothetical protein
VPDDEGDVVEDDVVVEESTDVVGVEDAVESVDVVGVEDAVDIVAVEEAVVVDDSATCSVAIVVLFVRFCSEFDDVAVAAAVTVYVPGSVGAFNVVIAVVEAPAGNDPSERVTTGEVAPAIVTDIATLTELAGPRPRFVTVSWSGIVPPTLITLVPSDSLLATMSGLGAAPACGGKAHNNTRNANTARKGNTG